MQHATETRKPKSLGEDKRGRGRVFKRKRRGCGAGRCAMLASLLAPPGHVRPVRLQQGCCSVCCCVAMKWPRLALGGVAVRCALEMRGHRYRAIC
eukprot:scaffold8531_cov130-Isochrysis_galbana.AAC.4